MSNKEYQLLGFEQIISETNLDTSTAEILELINDKPNAVFVVPIYGLRFPEFEPKPKGDK